MTPSDRIDYLTKREETLLAITAATIAEGVAVLLFLTMLFTWIAIGATAS